LSNRRSAFGAVGGLVASCALGAVGGTLATCGMEEVGAGDVFCSCGFLQTFEVLVKETFEALVEGTVPKAGMGTDRGGDDALG
jgi:hypothetical protein